MNRQFKALPYFAVKADASSKRLRKGICAVFGNVDSWGDRIQPGAFTKTITEGRPRVRHLWNHDFSQPPIASIKELKEVTREELPPEVLDYAPDASGGLMVSREYFDNEFSKHVLAAIDSGDITEMSFGYDVIRYETTKEGEREIRDLKELVLYDTSDVLWGMNAATVAAGAKGAIMPLGVLAQQIQFIANECKAGRRNATNDLKLLNAIHRATIDLGCDECAGILELEDQPKSEQAEAAINRTSLSANRLKLLQLNRNLTI